VKRQRESVREVNPQRGEEDGAEAARAPAPHDRGRTLEALARRLQHARGCVRIWRRVVLRLQHDWEQAGPGAPGELHALLHLFAAQTSYVGALREQQRARAAWRENWDEGRLPSEET
jgi:hypothetical protein